MKIKYVHPNMPQLFGHTTLTINWIPDVSQQKVGTCSGDETFNPLFRNNTILNQQVLQGHSRCALNSIGIAALSVTTQLLNFPPGLQAIMRMCNVPENWG